MFYLGYVPWLTIVIGMQCRMQPLLLCTFAPCPLLGVALKSLLTPLMTPVLDLVILFLCMPPSILQSLIALMAAARGNLPAAIWSATAPNLFGIFITVRPVAS